MNIIYLNSDYTRLIDESKIDVSSLTTDELLDLFPYKETINITKQTVIAAKLLTSLCNGNYKSDITKFIELTTTEEDEENTLSELDKFNKVRVEYNSNMVPVLLNTKEEQPKSILRRLVEKLSFRYDIKQLLKNEVFYNYLKTY